jgi:hypothetical protein
MPDIKEVKYGEDNPIDVAPKLTPEEEDSLKKRMEAMDKLLAEQGLAKYKLEITFERRRSLHAPAFGLMSFWQSGAKFHGGGDTKMYICPGKDLKRTNCDAFIPDSSTGYGFLVCPNCKTVWQGDQVCGEIGARLTTQDWAKLIFKYFVKLESNADIYMKYPKHDIRVVAEAEQEKQRGGERLAKARTDQQRAIYPLRNIIRDTSNGADLLTKFHQFLRA